MLYGLHLSAQGAQVQSLRQDVLANNLANASTPAFKRDLLRVRFHPQEDQLRGQAANTIEALKKLTGGLSPAQVVTDYRTGALQPSENPLDVALTGKGFLRVVDGNQEFLTRDGRLAISSNGTLVTREHALPVLGPDGNPVTGLDTASPLSISPDGTLTQNNAPVGQIGLVQPGSSQDLQKMGRNLYATAGELLPPGPESRLLQNHLEASGVNPVTEMVEMIETSRAYEANVNMIKHQDDSLGRLLASAGRK